MQRRKNILAMLMMMLILILMLAPMTSLKKTAATKKEASVSKAVTANLLTPRISVSKLTLVEGESQQLKVVSGSAWNLKKVTTTNKKKLGIYGKKPANKTVMVKGKEAASVETVKMHLEMKKSAWKKI